MDVVDVLNAPRRRQIVLRLDRQPEERVVIQSRAAVQRLQHVDNIGGFDELGAAAIRLVVHAEKLGLACGNCGSGTRAIDDIIDGDQQGFMVIEHRD